MVNIEKDLIIRCRKENRLAQEELYHILSTPLFRISKRYFRNDEDAMTAMHNGFLKILDKLSHYHYEKSFINWAKTVLIHSILDDLRKEKRKYGFLTEFNEDKFECDDRILLNEVEQIIEMENISEMLNVLPKATRIVFNLYVFEEYSHKEISAALGISAGTSKWHLSKAREEIKKILILHGGKLNFRAVKITGS